MLCILQVEGKTALHQASENGHEKVVEFLLRAGAHVQIRDTQVRLMSLLNIFVNSVAYYLIGWCSTRQRWTTPAWTGTRNSSLNF